MAVVMIKPDPIVPLYGWEAVNGVGALLSVTWAVKLNGPAVVGVPLMTPAKAFSASPAGRAPETISQVYGKAPPLTCSVVFGYGTFTVPLGTVVVVIVSGPLMARLKALLTVKG